MQAGRAEGAKTRLADDDVVVAYLEGVVDRRLGAVVGEESRLGDLGECLAVAWEESEVFSRESDADIDDLDLFRARPGECSVGSVQQGCGVAR